MKKVVRKTFRSFIRRVSFKGRGKLIDFFDPLLLSSSQELDKVFEVPYNFNFEVAPNNVRRQYYYLYEPEEVIFVRQNLKKGQTVVDIGANIGYMSAVFCSCVGKEGKVFLLSRCLTVTSSYLPWLKPLTQQGTRLLLLMRP